MVNSNFSFFEYEKFRELEIPEILRPILEALEILDSIKGKEIEADKGKEKEKNSLV